MNGSRSSCRCDRLVATVAALPFGIAIAWLLARREFPGKSLLAAVISLPLILPPVVTGYLLLVAFGKRGVLGIFFADVFGLVFSFRWTGAALACAIMEFPLLVQAIRISLEAIDRGWRTRRRRLAPVRSGWFRDRDIAARPTGSPRRNGAVLRPRARRVRRDDHVRVHHSR